MVKVLFWLKQYIGTLVIPLRSFQVPVSVLDIQLEQAFRRARWFTFFTVLVAWFVILVTRRNPWYPIVRHTNLTSGLKPFLTVGLTIVSLGVSFLAAYGFLRLYTLVCHVLTLNVFKTRGQRLRLFNLEVSMLPFVTVLCIGWLIADIWPSGGWTLGTLTSLFILYLMSAAYNTIFHKRRHHGFLLLFGGTLVTLFVLALGAVAVGAMFGVIMVFCVVALRLLGHHGHHVP